MDQVPLNSFTPLRNRGYGNDQIGNASYAIPAGYSPQLMNSSVNKFKIYPGYQTTMASASVQPLPTVPQAPRSAAEETFDSSSKFRQLPCRTFISVGTCPYRERCVYLHDPRCVCKDAKTKTRKKNKEDMMPDALFWPVMPYEMISSKLDVNQQPHVIQNYQVPHPQNNQYYLHDCALYSLWMHFVDSCVASNATADAAAAGLKSFECYSAPDTPVNLHTYRKRLPIFMLLSQSNGSEITDEEVFNCHTTFQENRVPKSAASVSNGSKAGKDYPVEEIEKSVQSGCASATTASLTIDDMGSSMSHTNTYFDLFRPIKSEMHKGWDYKDSYGAGYESKTISPSRTTQSSYSSKASTPRSSFDGLTNANMMYGNYSKVHGSYDIHDGGSTIENHSQSAGWLSELSTCGRRRDREGSLDTLDSLADKFQDVIVPEAQTDNSIPRAHRSSPFSPSHGIKQQDRANNRLNPQS